MIKPPKWTNVFPQGTKEGNEETSFFIALTYDKQYQWKSVAALAKETGLPRVKVEAIIKKYFLKGMLFQHPTNPDSWGYWEKVPHMLPEQPKTLAEKDQENRIKKAYNK